VSLGQYGSFAIDPVGLTDDTQIETGLSTDAFAGLRAFLDLARKVGVDGSPVKWQFVGPVTLGVALQRAGLRNAQAFTIAAEAVRHHVAQISAAVTKALPDSPQLMLLDEPWLTQLMSTDFPIPPDVAVDLISTGMAAVPADVAVGLHCCGSCDVATMLESGPQVISLPVSESLVDYAGYLSRFISGGGVIAWGVLPTVGPIPAKPDRYWRRLSEVWCALVERGVDASELRRRSLVSPECGLAQHQVSTARRVSRLTREVGRKVNAQATSTKLAFGA
jgi:methionine synthase II (cobalamin-independent)